jgi:AraC family transcriptional regulator
VFDLAPPEFDRQHPARSPPLHVITSLHRSSLATIDELACPEPDKEPRSFGFAGNLHILLPVSGSLNYCEEARNFFGGANHVLLVPAEREYRISHPIEGVRSLIVFPAPAIIELFVGLDASPCPDTEVRAVSPRLRLSACSLLSAARKGADPLTLDELSIDLCRAVADAQKVDSPAPLLGSGATLAKAKEFLHGHYREAIGLSEVAAAAGVTPVYLTQLFKRSLGLNLYQYVTALRLNESLFALLDAPDLTTLALDLGFSSHSHFTSVFRARFGTTPSCIRRHCLSDGASAVPPVFPQR